MQAPIQDASAINAALALGSATGAAVLIWDATPSLVAFNPEAEVLLPPGATGTSLEDIAATLRASGHPTLAKGLVTDGSTGTVTRVTVAPGLVATLFAAHPLRTAETTGGQPPAALLSVAIDKLDEGITLLDHRCRVIAINARMLQIFGVHPSLMGPDRHISDFINHHADLVGLSAEERAATIEDRVRFALGDYAPGGTYERTRFLASGGVLHVRRVVLPGANVLMSVRDVTESYSLARKSKQLEMVLENIDEGVIMADKNLTLEVLNANVFDFYGVDHEAVRIGDPFRKFVEASEDLVGLTAEERESIVQDRLGYASLEANDVVRRTRILRNGRALQITRVPLGPDRGFVATHRDATAEIERQTLLEKARQAAEEANRLKSDFIAKVTHELRTPMHGVMGLAALLEQSPLDDKQSHFLDALQRSGRHMVELIDSLLTISTLETGDLTLEVQPCDLEELVRNCIQMVEPEAGRRGLDLSADCAFNPPRVLGDATRMTQIIVNLLANALKFTEHGTIRLSAMSERLAMGVGITVAVSDSGRGVPEDMLDTIFAKFSQIRPKGAHKTEGVGLGLTIAHSLTELMGGTIMVESTVGVGSTFTFSVVLPEAPGGAG